MNEPQINLQFMGLILQPVKCFHQTTDFQHIKKMGFKHSKPWLTEVVIQQTT